MTDYASLAADVAREAGQYLKHFSDSHALCVEAKGSDYDFVTNADRESQALIQSRIRAAFPAHRFIGEEDGFSDAEVARVLESAGPDECFWIADPLDGTLNYIHHLGGYSVSLAMVRGGRPVCGAVCVPESGEVYVAERGAGAFVGDVRLKASECAALCHAITSTGYAVSDMDLRRRSCKWIDAVAMATLNMRNMGSAARSIAMTAAGRLEAYFEIGPHPWDVAAGIVLCEEAGCRVSTLAGEPYRIGNPSVMACAPGIHEALCRLIRENGGQ